jgi:hypothetical protein
MATGIPDPSIKDKPSVWKIVLNLIYSGLGALKSMGVFSKGPGPKL